MYQQPKIAMMLVNFLPTRFQPTPLWLAVQTNPVGKFMEMYSPLGVYSSSDPLMNRTVVTDNTFDYVCTMTWI
jgi:hypothetical protein